MPNPAVKLTYGAMLAFGMAGLALDSHNFA
jgi:hypothetical protein